MLKSFFTRANRPFCHHQLREEEQDAVMIASTASTMLRRAATNALRQRNFASVSQANPAASTSASSSSSQWKPPIEPGVELAYDEALKCIATHSAYLKEQIPTLEAEVQATEPKSYERIAAQARLRSHLIASQVNDPNVRWRFDNDPTISLGEPVYAHLREKAWREGSLPLIEQRIRLMRVVPEATPTFVPLVDVQLFIGEGSGIHDHGGEGGPVQVGCFVDARKTLTPPQILATPFHEEEQLYTIALVDADAPFPEEDRIQNVIHWLVHNVPLSLTKTHVMFKPEDVVLPYIPPHPERGTDYHRYALVLLEQQSGPIAMDTIKKDALKREQFEMSLLAREHDLRTVGVHFWRAQWTPASADAISTVYKTILDRPEPRYKR